MIHCLVCVCVSSLSRDYPSFRLTLLSATLAEGHSRQGLKCKMCKINVHFGDCQDRAPKCQVSLRATCASLHPYSDVQPPRCQLISLFLL